MLALLRVAGILFIEYILLVGKDELPEEPFPERSEGWDRVPGIEDAFTTPGGGEYFDAGFIPIFKYTGLTLLILGLLAFFLTKQDSDRHDWGKWIASVGLGFTIISINFSGFMSLINKFMGFG